MPIQNYNLKASTSKDSLLERTDLTKENKQHLKHFLDYYETYAKPATQNIFHTHIWQMLRKTKDIKKDMKNQEIIIKIFNELSKELNPTHYDTVVKVSKYFVKWLNKGDLPKGFKYVKRVSSKSKKRSLTKEDMITWEEGLNASNKTNSIQLKAMIMTQLDGGFRPSEFVDLDYGDVEFKKPFYLVRVKDGKTGAREVILFKSVPYLMRWVTEHPTKKPEDPLWLTEFTKSSKAAKRQEGKIIRYQYSAILKRVKDVFHKAGLKKPSDFYNFRHSACRLSKLENMPIELASKKFGHSTEYYVNTYGRLDSEDEINRHNEFLGIETEKKEPTTKEKTIFCEVCKHVNPPRTEICKQCATPLTVQKAMEIKQKEDERFNKLADRLDKLESRETELVNDNIKKGKIRETLKKFSK